MRLTLRTMLAYVNDLLEPADAEEVGKRIAESEFANGLMHRMRDVTRRLRLGAPRLHGRGMGHDPNTVAEYLDHELPSDRVADFEKVCLESDMHLAEVASCHQILALVLGEPAEIESASRQRMYALPQQAEASAHAPPVAKPAKASRDGKDRASRRKKKRRKVKVPEYLREPAAEPQTPRRWGGLLTAAVVLVAAGIGLTMYWPQIAQHLPSIEPDNASETQVASNPSSDGQNRSNDQNVPNEEQHNADRQTAPPDNQAAGDSAAGNPAATQQSANAKNNQAEQAPTASPQEDEPDQVSRPAMKEASPAPDDATQTEDAAARPQANTGTLPKRSQSETRRPAAGRSQQSEPATDDVPARERIAPPPRSDNKSADVESPRAKAAGEGIGRLVSESDVLLREAGDEWQRVPIRGTVYTTERLIALPTYRPSIAMSNGITLQLLGGAMVSLGAPSDGGGAQIQLSSGRILLLTAAKPDTSIRLQAGDYQGTIEFGEGESALAVEVRHLLPEGADPEQEPAPTAVELYLSSGEVTWVGRPGRSEKLSGRSHRALGGDGGGQSSEELPAWIESGQLNPNERRAAGEVADYLPPDKPVMATLEELAQHRRLENSLLAVRSLALIDDFEPIVPLLNDPKYRTVWTWQIESLRTALARGPRTAKAVREAFQRARGKEEGGELYRMLWGYSEQQLRDGAAAQLIDWLGAPDEQLDFRVLSFWNLRHITGMGLYYQPADPEKQRRQSIQRWKQKLDAGLLVPKAASATVVGFSLSVG